MDSKPALATSSPFSVEESLSSSNQDDLPGPDPEDPFTFNGTSIALLGMIIAIATVGVPLLAVLSFRPFGGERIVPTAMESNGSKPSVPISFTRGGQSGGGDSRW